MAQKHEGRGRGRGGGRCSPQGFPRAESLKRSGMRFSEEGKKGRDEATSRQRRSKGKRRGKKGSTQKNSTSVDDSIIPAQAKRRGLGLSR